MSDDAGGGLKKSSDAVSLARVLEDARALSQERARARAEVVPLFPEPAQPVVARVIDARVSEVIYQRAFRSLKASLPQDASAPLDLHALREQREQVRALQAVLKETGGTWFGDRLASVLDTEVLRGLAALQQDGQQPSLREAASADVARWQGEPLALAKALGADAGPALPPSFARVAIRLDLLAQQARTLLALGSPALAADPAAARWIGLQAELERYAAHASDSSLLRLERYLGALGPDLRRENCAERLASQTLVALHDDEIAQRHQQLHQALTQRCGELRAQMPSSAAAPFAP
jgi:type VI secretion system protein ImpL